MRSARASARTHVAGTLSRAAAPFASSRDGIVARVARAGSVCVPPMRWLVSATTGHPARPRSSPWGATRATPCLRPTRCAHGCTARAGRLVWRRWLTGGPRTEIGKHAWFACPSAMIEPPRSLLDSLKPSEAVRWVLHSGDSVIASHPRRQQFRRLLTAGVRGLGAVIAAAAAVWVAAAGPGLPALALALGAGVLAFGAWRDLKVSRRNRVGADSEAAVRRALKPLARDGWSVRHGVGVRTGGDLDHVLRAPSGVGFVIETKTARYTPAHAARTIRAARRLARRRRRYPGGVVPVLCIARSPRRAHRVRRAARRLARPSAACAARGRSRRVRGDGQSCSMLLQDCRSLYRSSSRRSSS
jgi:nuclease-like protein